MGRDYLGGLIYIGPMDFGRIWGVRIWRWTVWWRQVR
jgi:hypothetical protein